MIDSQQMKQPIIYDVPVRQWLLIVVAIMVSLLMVQPGYAKYAGASLQFPACDPGADPNTDAERIQPSSGKYHYTQSCINHYSADGKKAGANPIGIDNFAIRIRFDPAIASSAQGASIAVLGSAVAPIAAPAFILGGAGLAMCGLATPPQEFWVEVGKTGGVCATAFHVEQEGDMACVYAFPLGMFHFAVDDREASAPNDGAEKHCFIMPPPRATMKPPIWASFISPTCTYFCNAYDDDNNPATPDRSACGSKARDPFLGVVVQCISETMDNLFYSSVDGSGETIFTIMQLHLKRIITGLLTLYVLFVSYQFLMRKAKVERSEFLWYFLKFGLVLYFAGSSGLLVLKPALENLSQGLSLMLLEAGFGTEGDFSAAQQATRDAQTDLDQASDRFLLARKALSVVQVDYEKTKQALQVGANCTANITQCPPEITTLPPAAQKAAIAAHLAEVQQDQKNQEALILARQNDLQVEKNNYATKAETHHRALSYEGSFGYNLCDFRAISYGDNGTNIATQHFADGSIQKRDMSYLRLWDMVDCRIMKYLGVGDYNGSSRTPQVLMIALGMVFTNALGVMIFFLTLIFFIFIILLIFRIAHIYLMALIALNLLIYLGPLLIPAVLFNSQKHIFEMWLKQITAYTLQPVILFAFLTFLFATFDQIVYGDNHLFYPMNYGGDDRVQAPDGSVDPAKVAAQLARIQKRNQIVKYMNPEYPGDETKARCPDEDTMGCIYQRISEKFSRTPDFGFGSDFTFTKINNVTTNEGVVIFLSMMKLFIMAFLMHSVLGILENISNTLVNTIGGGATKLSAAPSPGLTGAASMVGGATQTAGKLAGQAGGWGAKAAVRGARGGAKAIQQAANGKK